MKSYTELMSNSELPSTKQLFDTSYLIENFGRSFTIINASIEKPNIVLSMTINEFFDFCKLHDISEVYCNYTTYKPTDYAITSSAIRDNDDLYDFVKYVIAKYNTSLDEDDQIDIFMKILQEKNSVLPILDNICEDDDEDEEYSESEEAIDITDYIKLIDIESLRSENSEIDEDDFNNENNKEYTLSTTANSILDDVIAFNESIPEELLNVIETVEVSCVINGIIYTVELYNNLEFDIELRFAEILSKYQSKYEENVYKSLDISKQEQLRIEQEKKLAIAKKEQDRTTFIDQLLRDFNFTSLTNDTMRRMFIADIFNNESNLYRDLMISAYSLSMFIERNYNISTSTINTILQEIKAKALQKHIKLGSKIAPQ